MEMQTQFESKTDFSLYIERLAKENDQSLLKTITDYCEITGFEYATIAELVSQTLKQKLYEEATQSYAMPKMSDTLLDY